MENILAPYTTENGHYFALISEQNVKEKVKLSWFFFPSSKLDELLDSVSTSLPLEKEIDQLRPTNSQETVQMSRLLCKSDAPLGL